MIEHQEDWPLSKLCHFRSASTDRRLAEFGFAVFGTNAAAAVPALDRVLNGTNHDSAESALKCLAAIGPPAEAPVCRALTNANPEIRILATLGLADAVTNVHDFLTRLRDRLHDPDSFVRVAAVSSIGSQTNSPDEVISFLVLAFKEEDDFVASSAANKLVDFGTNACPVVGDLIKAARGERMVLAFAATRTLLTIAPDEALPIIASRCSSTDANWRLNALQLLYDSPLTNGVIQSLIESAASDPDGNISQRAKEFLTDQYCQEQPEELLFPDEPSYQGKQLGDWLDMAHGGSVLSQDAFREAFRHMGTNAVPALLRRLVYVRPPFGLPAEDINMEAVDAFLILGEDAKSTLPQLESLMESPDKNVARHAMLAACNLGPGIVDCLVKGLTSQNAEVRSEAADYLTQLPGYRFPERRKQAVPALLKLLDDPDAHVRMNAANALKEIDPEKAALAGLR
jgi:HEAT repeat protein